MQIDPRIPMMFQTPDFVGSAARGAQAGQFVNDARHQNALRMAVSEHGAGLVNGDPNARSALAGLDPGMVLQADKQRSTIKDMEARLELAYQQTYQQAQVVAAKLSAEQRAQIQAEYDQGRAVLSTAQTPEQWDEFARRLGVEDAIGDFENRSFWIAQGLAVKDAMAMNAEPKDTAKEQQIARLMEGGLDRNTAIGLADGRLELSQTGEVIDRATGRPITPMEDVPGAPAPTVPQASYSSAFGPMGVASNAANTIVDMFGGNLPAPETRKAHTALTNVALRTVTTMQKSFPGRASVQLMQKLEQIAARPAEFFSGPRTARDTMEQTATMIEEFMRTENQRMRDYNLTPQMRAEARQNVHELAPLLSDYQEILSQMADAGVGNKPTEWMLHTDPATWTEEQKREAEKMWGTAND